MKASKITAAMLLSIAIFAPAFGQDGSISAGKPEASLAMAPDAKSQRSEQKAKKGKPPLRDMREVLSNEFARKNQGARQWETVK